MKKFIAILLAFVFCIPFVACGEKDGTDISNDGDGSFTNGDASTGTTTNGSSNATGDEVSAAPDGLFDTADIDKDAVYTAEIIIKDYGNILIQLDQSRAPITVANFINLATSGFYNGLTFHRIIEGFMMQGGCPLGTGTGGADKDIIGEFSNNGYTYNNISHLRGVISMARATPYNSGSSQFFIMHEDYTGLDGEYAAFGWVLEGMDVVDAVCTAAKPVDGNGTIPSYAQPVIETVIIRKA